MRDGTSSISPSAAERSGQVASDGRASITVRISLLALAVLVAAVLGYYGLVHWRVIWLVEPATAREGAMVVNVEGLLDPSAPRPFSLESIPRYANVYGVGYLWGGAPFVKWLPFTTAESLRIANAAFLAVLLSLMCFALRKAPPVSRWFAVALVYGLFVSSPSIAASPDVMASALYFFGWVLVAEFGSRWWALVVSVLIGALAVLTKPYVLLLIPGVASYLFLFRSLRSGIGYCLLAVGIFAPTLWVIGVVYPCYWAAVVGTNWEFSLGDLHTAVSQWKEFVVLVPVPSLFAGLVLWGWGLACCRSARLSWRWREPFFRNINAIDCYLWGALVGAAALAGSLSWNDGAHMTYFWHLLLPLLVMGVLRCRSVHPLWLCLNLVVLLVLRPPLPAVGLPDGWRQLQMIVARHDNIYLDPFLAALHPPERPGREGDNAHSEYLLSYGPYSDFAGLEDRTMAFMRAQRLAFETQVYDGIMLTDHTFYFEHLKPFIHANYRVAGVFTVRSYYTNFRDRRSFGRTAHRVVYYQPIHRDQGSGPVHSETP